MSWRKAALELSMGPESLSGREIGRRLGIPKSTVHDFLRTQPGYEPPVPVLPRILLADIETAPSICHVWSRWKQNIYQPQVIHEGFIMTWAAKWLGTQGVMFDSCFHHEERYARDSRDDTAIVSSFHKLLEQADIVVFQNGDRFDIPWLNTRFIYHDLHRPAPYKAVDTLKILKKNFRLPSNGLDNALYYFGLEGKLENGGFKLWKECIENHDSEQWKLMMDYNVQDITALENLYLFIRGWDYAHPNLALHFDDDVKRCGVCACTDLKKERKKHYTQASAFTVHRCQNCSALYREASKDPRAPTLRPVGK